MMTLEDVEVHLKKDHIHVILEGMIKAVVVDQDHPLLIGIGLDVLNVGSMITLLKTVQTQIQEKANVKFR